jgi:hypothetical protein
MLIYSIFIFSNDHRLSYFYTLQNTPTIIYMYIYIKKLLFHFRPSKEFDVFFKAHDDACDLSGVWYEIFEKRRSAET